MEIRASLGQAGEIESETAAILEQEGVRCEEFEPEVGGETGGGGGGKGRGCEQGGEGRAGGREDCLFWGWGRERRGEGMCGHQGVRQGLGWWGQG